MEMGTADDIRQELEAGSPVEGLLVLDFFNCADCQEVSFRTKRELATHLRREHEGALLPSLLQVDTRQSSHTHGCNVRWLPVVLPPVQPQAVDRGLLRALTTMTVDVEAMLETSQAPTHIKVHTLFIYLFIFLGATHDHGLGLRFPGFGAYLFVLSNEKRRALV